MLQRILMWVDEVSLTNRLHLSDGENEIVLMSGCNPDRWMGIIGKDGNIHTVTDAEAVKHFYKDGKPIKRVLARKDLRAGERLATEEEIHIAREKAAMESISKRRTGMF